jgi:TRAP-type C4-dicarboxylate transport system substrate-binding protein
VSAEDYLTHYIDLQAWQPRNIIFVNKEAFGKLSAAEKKAVTDAAAAAEERGWKASVEEMAIKTEALRKAGIKVMPPSPELKAGLNKVGDTIAAEWTTSAGADGKAIIDAYRK